MQNPEKKHIRQFQVDGAVFPKGAGPERCDVLLLNDTDKQSYYVELKGTDIPKAVRQIENTISLINPSINYTIYCRIVVHKARTHKINDRSVIAWKKKRGERAIKIQSSPMNDKIEKAN